MSKPLSLREIKKILLSQSTSETRILDICNENIADAPVINEIVNFIKSSKATQVYLEGCSLQDSNIAIFSSFLKTDSTLEVLSFRDNIFTQRGVLQLSEALRLNTNSKITCLDVLGNPIGNFRLSALPGFKNLTSFCGLRQGLTTLVLQNIIAFSDFQVLAAELEKNKHLKFLEINGCEGIDLIIETLVNNTSLLKLKIANMTFNDTILNAMARSLPQNRSLRSIEIHISPHSSDLDIVYCETCIVR